MLRAIRARLAPPTFEGDPDKTRIGGLLHSSLLAMFAMGLVFVPLGAMSPGSYPGVLAIMAAMTALVPASLLWLVRRGHVRLSCVLLVSLFFMAIVGAVAVVGSVRAPIASLFLVCIVIAGLIFNHRGTVVVAVLSLLAIFGLWSAERAGLRKFPMCVPTSAHAPMDWRRRRKYNGSVEAVERSSNAGADVAKRRGVRATAHALSDPACRSANVTCSPLRHCFAPRLAGGGRIAL